MHSVMTDLARGRCGLIGPLLVGIFSLLLNTAPAHAAATGPEGDLIDNLIQEIERDTAETRRYTGRSELSARVMDAMRQVDRARFVPPGSAVYAWENRPLPIGYRQTISQPFIVALMTDLLEPEPHHRVLELGTGSGYQAAVLASLVASVHTIEIVPELAESAARRLQELGYDNVTVRAGDGWHGWPEAAPFDAVIVTAVAEEIPPKLIEQMKPGGRLVMPVGPQNGGQNLTVLTRTAEGISQREVLPVQFVPLTRSNDDE